MLPILETDRLILRPRAMDDLGSCVDMDKDPEVTEYLPGVWDGGPEHMAFLEERITKSYPAGLGYWSVFPKDNPSDFLGWVHLLPAEEDERTTDIGWRFRRSAWGKGYATEAAKIILDYAFETIGSGRVTASTLSTNDRSKRMMDRLGMRYVADFMYDGRLPSSSYRITGQEYLIK